MLLHQVSCFFKAGDFRTFRHCSHAADDTSKGRKFRIFSVMTCQVKDEPVGLNYCLPVLDPVRSDCWRTTILFRGLLSLRVPALRSRCRNAACPRLHRLLSLQEEFSRIAPHVPYIHEFAHWILGFPPPGFSP